MIIYEAPHRLLKTLKELLETLGNRRATICRELTKKHETFFVTTLEEAIYHYEATEPKGECIIVVEGLSREAIIEEARSKWDEMTVEEHITNYINQGIDKKEAVKQVAKDRGLPKREIYDIAKNM